MNSYLMGVYHFFEGYKNFTIEAENKKDAVSKGLIYVKRNPIYSSGGNYNTDDVKCIKKIHKRKKEANNRMNSNEFSV